jgi:plasmid maintenance system antidote protein VapI
MNLQTHYDLTIAEESLSGRIEREVTSLAELHAA